MRLKEWIYDLVSLFLIWGRGSQGNKSPGCGKELPENIKLGESHFQIINVTDPVLGDHIRTLMLHIPDGYDKDVPMPVVVDFHGWGGFALIQETYSHFTEVSDTDPDPFIVATPDGKADNYHPGKTWGSFNCSRTDGPLGPPCDTNRTRWGEIECYSSCPNCDPTNSCDWTSCFDDIHFTRTLVNFLADNFCVDMSSIHQSGMSNGGMFSYYMASELSDIFASIAPVAGSPLIGFWDIPPSPLNLFDIHGINDGAIPYDHAHAEGVGPHNSVTSFERYYYVQKQDVINKWTSELGCNDPEVYETHMDGENGWNCKIWKGCQEGQSEVVSCTGDHGHSYPFINIDSAIEGTRIIWNFMKNHPKT